MLRVYLVIAFLGVTVLVFASLIGIDMIIGG